MREIGALGPIRRTRHRDALSRSYFYLLGAALEGF